MLQSVGLQRVGLNLTTKQWAILLRYCKHSAGASTKLLFKDHLRQTHTPKPKSISSKDKKVCNLRTFYHLVHIWAQFICICSSPTLCPLSTQLLQASHCSRGSTLIHNQVHYPTAKGNIVILLSSHLMYTQPRWKHCSSCDSIIISKSYPQKKTRQKFKYYGHIFNFYCRERSHQILTK